MPLAPKAPAASLAPGVVARAFLRGLMLLPALLIWPAAALDYRSVEPEAAPGAAVPNAAILYDAPSKQGAKRFIVRRYTPVEVVVSMDGWSKVRDADGGLAWISAKSLSERRTVQVTAERATVRQSPANNAALLFEAEKGVALELLEGPAAGWAKVRHRDGASGYLRVSEVWGL